METDSGVNSSSHSLEIFTSDIGDEDGKSLSGLSVSKNWNWKENSKYVYNQIGPKDLSSFMVQVTKFYFNF